MLLSSETLLGPTPPRSAYLEGYRILRNSVLALQEKEPFTTALITSPGQREGKTTVAINLATMLALAEKSCIIVDADFYGTSASEILGCTGRAGLTDVCAGRVQPKEALVGTESPFLRVLSAGTLADEGPELIATGAVHKALEALRSEAEFVLCDTTPINGFGAAVSLARAVDMVLVVVLARSPVADVQRSLATLKDTGARLGGVIVNDVLPGDSLVHRSYHRYYGRR